MFGLGGSELLVIALVALLVFGPGRIPEVARAIAAAYRELTKLRSQVDDTVGELRRDLDLNMEPLDLKGKGVRPLLHSRSRLQRSADRDSAPRSAPLTTAGVEAGADVDDYLATAASGHGGVDEQRDPEAKDPEPGAGAVSTEDAGGNRP